MKYYYVGASKFVVWVQDNNDIYILRDSKWYWWVTRLRWDDIILYDQFPNIRELTIEEIFTELL